MKKTIVKPSAVPILGIGGVWLIYCLFLPLYRPWHLLFPALTSVAAFFVLKKLFPGKTVTVKVSSGNPDLDAMTEEGERAISKMRALNDAIADETLSRRIDELEDLTNRIFESVQRDPAKLPQIRRFMNYYLPTTLKLLEQYSVLQHQSLAKGNVSEAMKKIEDMMKTIVLAFSKQLDTLYQKDVMDITAEIQVLEQMMKSQGILQTDDFN
ncbi:MAG: hypothetical protein E7449_03645 [Ruminococcaceae bacterium]|nr:hypothetical protein [Oscillospiraceae bacterium]